MQKFKFRLDRSVVAIFILVVGTYYAFTHNVKTVNAVTNPSGQTGTFGCMLTRNGSGYGTLWQNADSIGTNVLMYIDYGTNTTKGLVNSTSKYGTANVTTATDKFTTTFTETAVDGVTGVYKLAHTITNSLGAPGGTSTFMGIVVNSGNTILMTQTESGEAKATWSGVCQKS